MTYPATVLNDLENIEGTDAEIRCHWHGFLVDIFISCILNLRLTLQSLPFSFFFLVFTYGCPCEVHTRSVAKRYRCGHWLWSKDLLLFIDCKKYACTTSEFLFFFFFSMEVEFSPRVRASLMPTYNITFTIPGGYVGERACSIRVNWTRLTRRTRLTLIRSAFMFRSTVRYLKIIASSFKSIFLSMSHLL